MKKYIMALDQGTTSSRCVIYDSKGNSVAFAQKEFKQIFPESGWVEHDPMDIWNSQLQVAREAMEKGGLKAENIDSIGITNQRETTIVWDKTTGTPVYNAIVWQCRRTSEYCEMLKSKDLEKSWKKKTGLPIDPYFSATKLEWILTNVPEAREKAKEGRLLFGTVDSWLLWNLTGGKVHATDVSNASRTMMYNIEELRWDEDILDTLGIPKIMLPQVMDSSCIYGTTEEGLFDGSIRIGGIAGDQQAALFGQTCFEEGMAKNTFGTGGFLLINTGSRIVRSTSGMINTIGWKIGEEIKYAIEGSAFVSGASLQWLRDGLKIIDSAHESEELCNSVDDTGGVYLVPAFTGLGAPYWDPYARGLISGLTRGTGIAHVVRAAVESMAYQTWDLIDAAEKDMAHFGRQASEEDISLLPSERPLRVDGGATMNDFLLQFQADILGREVIRPKVIETTSLGAAYLAGLATGYWKDKEEIKQVWQADRVFRPNMDISVRNVKLKGWHEAVERALSGGTVKSSD